MFERVNTDAADGRIAHKSDVRGGIGPIKVLINLDKWLTSDRTHDRARTAACEARNVYQDGDTYKCGLCGYDRALYETHTEVDAHTLTCHNCEKRLAVWGREA